MSGVSKKIVILGNESVGKTSLIKQYVHSIFSGEYLTTIGINISKKVIVQNEVNVKLMIWDVAGDLLDHSLYTKYLLGAHAIVLVCDVTRPETFDSIDKKVIELKEEFPKIELLTVGNKYDLIENKEEYKPNCDILTSAKTDENVNEIFEQLVKKMHIGE